MDITQRECVKCGAVISFSKFDAKQGKIPKNPICGNCITFKKQGQVDIVSPLVPDEEKPFAEGKTYKKKWSRDNG